VDAAVELNVDMWVTDPAARELVRAMQRRVFELTLGMEDEEEEESFEPGAVRVRTLIAVGDRDYEDFRAIGRRLAEEVPDARLEVLPGAGHLMALERPAETAALLREFLVSRS
jgi:3-oxoadipate enol-lactonase